MQRFNKEAAFAYYFYCVMHCINLSSSKAFSVPSIWYSQEGVSDSTVWFRSSAMTSCRLRSCIKSHDIQISNIWLTKIYNTRFTERHTSIVCFQRNIKELDGRLPVLKGREMRTVVEDEKSEWREGKSTTGISFGTDNIFNICK